MLLNLTDVPLGTLKGSKEVMEEMTNLNLEYADVTELIISNCNLKSLEGVEDFYNLTTLIASHNSISSIDHLHALKKLKIVKLDHNNINSITISHSFQHLQKFEAGSKFHDDLILQDNIKLEDVLEPHTSFTSEVQDTSFASVVASDFNTPVAASELSADYVSPDFGISAIDVPCAVFFEYFDVSNNGLEQLVFEVSFKALVLMLSNNRLSSISGMSNVSILEVLDLSYNIECNVQQLLECTFSNGCNLFLENTRVVNEYLFDTLLQSEGLTIHADITMRNDRVIGPMDLDLQRLKTKHFTDTKLEYADFVYEGDESPMELLTPRCINDRIDGGVYVKRSLAKLGHLETQSTIDDVNCLNKSLSITIDYNNLEELNLKGTDFENDMTSRYYSYPSPPPPPSSLLMRDGPDSEFLDTSIKLCKKIDVWNDDLKNTLYND